VRPTRFTIENYDWQARDRKSSDLIDGWDPNGEGRITLTARAIDKMPIDDFKRFSRVTVQPKPDFARSEDRENFLPAQFSQLGGRVR
jgi:hypothetical protein